MTRCGATWCDRAVEQLRRGRPYEALRSYAGAVACASPPVLVVALADLDQQVEAAAPGAGWARRLLLIALALREGDGWCAELQREATPAAAFGPGPVCLMVGSTADDTDLAEVEPVVLEAFRDHGGVVVSGGTAQGVAGLVGKLGQEPAAGVRTVGYAPRPGRVHVNEAYHEIRRTSGEDFSPLEALQCWTDLVAGGADPAAVRVLGIGGGRISAVEYRVALALGAWVGVLRDSDRAVHALLHDADWRASPRLVTLAADAGAIRSFLHGCRV